MKKLTRIILFLLLPWGAAAQAPRQPAAVPEAPPVLGEIPPAGRFARGPDQPGYPAASQPPYVHYVRGGSGSYRTPPLIFRFTPGEEAKMDSLEEDLNVMNVLLQRTLDREFGQGRGLVRMGIPLLVSSPQAQAIYLEGFGALFSLQANFPLVGGVVSDHKGDGSPPENDWEAARNELRGIQPADQPGTEPHPQGVAPYNADQIGALKKGILAILKQAANIRDLRPEDYVAVTIRGPGVVESGSNGGEMRPQAPGRPNGPGPAGVGGGGSYGSGWTVEMYKRYGFPVPPGMGGPSPALPGYAPAGPYRPDGSPGPGAATLLAIRVKKKDIDAYAKGTLGASEFNQKAAIQAYRTGGESGVADAKALPQ